MNAHMKLMGFGTSSKVKNQCSRRYVGRCCAGIHYTVEPLKSELIGAVACSDFSLFGFAENKPKNNG